MMKCYFMCDVINTKIANNMALSNFTGNTQKLYCFSFSFMYFLQCGMKVWYIMYERLITLINKNLFFE